MRADFFDTVEILIAQLCLRRAPSVFFVEPFAYVADEFFARFKFFHVVVADDQLDLSRFHFRAHAFHVIKALASLGRRGRFVCGKRGEKFARHYRAVDHFALCRAGMNVFALKIDDGFRGVKGFVSQLAQLLAIYGIGEIAPEARYVEQGRALADFLVWGKRDSDFSVPDFGTGGKLLDELHDLRDARFVVRAQQGRAVCDNQLLSDIFFENGKLAFRDDFAVFQPHVAAADDAVGLDVPARAYGFGVHVRDEPQRGKSLGVCGKLCIDIAVFVEAHVLRAQRFQLLRQQARESELLFCAGVGARLGV